MLSALRSAAIHFSVAATSPFRVVAKPTHPITNLFKRQFSEHESCDATKKFLKKILALTPPPKPIENRDPEVERRIVLDEYPFDKNTEEVETPATQPPIVNC